MRNDLVIRSEVMRSLTEEYNRRYKEGGLKLAWIEKAVNEVPGTWIRSADRLPDGSEGDWVLGVATGANCINAITLVDYDPETRNWYLTDRPSVSVAVPFWMPLPDAPEEVPNHG